MSQLPEANADLRKRPRNYFLDCRDETIDAVREARPLVLRACLLRLMMIGPRQACLKPLNRSREPGAKRTNPLLRERVEHGRLPDLMVTYPLTRCHLGSARLAKRRYLWSARSIPDTRQTRGASSLWSLREITFSAGNAGTTYLSCYRRCRSSGPGLHWVRVDLVAGLGNPARQCPASGRRRDSARGSPSAYPPPHRRRSRPARWGRTFAHSPAPP